MNTRPYIVAHRGVPSAARENTIPAFEEAIRQGADFIECDIRRTANGICILHHDEAVGTKKIPATPLADLRQAASTLGYQIDTLEDLLTSLRGRIRVDFELKEPGYEAGILSQIAAAGWSPGSFVITSFNDASIAAVKAAQPENRCGLLLGCDLPEHSLCTRFNELFPVRRLHRCGADFAAPNIKLLHFGFLQRVTSAGFSVWVWTANDPREIEQLLRGKYVEAIITDVPKLICGQRTQHIATSQKAR